MRPERDMATSNETIATTQQRRGFWLRMLHQWHWISSALCLIGMLMFTITGLTLNHAARIEASPSTEHRTLTLPPALLKTWATAKTAMHRCRHTWRNGWGANWISASARVLANGRPMRCISRFRGQAAMPG